MKKINIMIIAIGCAVTAASIPDAGTKFAYEVAAVKRQLLLVTDDGETPLSVGDSAHSGDSLRTGKRSSAELVVEDKTSFRLAGDRPGVLIDVERGSLRAIFGALSDGDGHERLVTTPSAVLAVRGTEYGVEVEKDGDTSVVVFKGTVDVISPASGESVRVAAGQASRIRKGRAPSKPRAHGLSSEDWDRGRRSGSGGQGSGGRQSTGSASQAGGGQRSGSQGGSKRHGG